MILGITGRVGTGKSRAASIILNHFEFELLDLDVIGHELLKNDRIKSKIIESFGSDVLDANGNIVRPELSRKVFSDSNQLLLLNQIIHPAIKEFVIAKIKSVPQRPYLVVGALIKEIKLTDVCHAIIVIDAADEDIMKAVPEKFNRIAGSQRSRLEYLQESPYCITNIYQPKQLEEDCIRVVRNRMSHHRIKNKE